MRLGMTTFSDQERPGWSISQDGCMRSNPMEERNAEAHFCHLWFLFPRTVFNLALQISQLKTRKIFIHFLCRKTVSPSLYFKNSTVYLIISFYAFHISLPYFFTPGRKSCSTSPFLDGPQDSRYVALTVTHRATKGLHLPCLMALLLGVTTIGY